MPEKSKTFYALAAAALLLIAAIAWAVWTYNSLGSLMTDIGDSQSEIDDLMQRQADVIPQLKDAVDSLDQKGSEDPVEALLAARQGYAAAVTDQQKNTAILQMQKAIDKMYLYGLSNEALKNDTGYKAAFKELADDQNKIISSQGAIKKYDASVAIYNKRLCVFPANVIAGIFHYTSQQSYGVSGQISQAKIKLK